MPMYAKDFVCSFGTHDKRRAGREAKTTGEFEAQGSLSQGV